MLESNEFQPTDKNFESKVHESFTEQPFMKTLGAIMTKVVPGYCEIRLPFSEQLTQQNGFFHAGVVGTIADNTGGYAAYSLMPEGSSVLTVEYKLNLLAPACGDYLVARGRVVRHGRKLTVCLSEISSVKDGQEKLCAMAVVTLICVQTEALSS